MTIDEHKLLLAVSTTSHGSVGGNRSATPEIESQHVRSNLRETLKVKRDALTEPEATFIDSLVNATDVSVEDLVTCNQVLDNDPLFNDSISDSETTPSQRQTQSTSQKSYDLWSYCSTPGSQAFSCRNFDANQSPISPEKTNKTAESLPKESSKKENSFTYFWKRTFGLVRKEKFEEPELQETVSCESDEDMNFYVLSDLLVNRAAADHVLTPPIMDALRPHMPFAVQQDNFWLKYSMVRDGASLKTMLQKVRGSARTIIAIETSDGHVMGTFTSSPWRTSSRFYGSGEAFLWRMKKTRFTQCDSVEAQVELESNLDIFGWSGRNRNIQFVPGDMSGLKVGGGGIMDEDMGIERGTDSGFGLVLESYLDKGYSDKCETFGDPSPSIYGDGNEFDIVGIEVWTMTPTECVKTAEQLELGRQFIFDHGNFVQD